MESSIEEQVPTEPGFSREQMSSIPESQDEQTEAIQRILSSHEHTLSEQIVRSTQPIANWRSIPIIFHFSHYYIARKNQDKTYKLFLIQ